MNYEIPKEIQMYNIVNFIPSPINNDIQIDLLAKVDLKGLKAHDISKEIKYIDKSDDMYVEQETYKKVILPQLSGYPYFDMDLSFLFNYFNFESFFTAYIFSLLEFKMIFFSPSLSLMNTFMYMLRFLTYPFIDNNDSGQIYSISKNEFLNGNKIENNLIGVNCAYDGSITIPSFYKDYFIISYQNHILNLYFNGEMVFSFDSKKKDEDENSNIIDARINENIKKIINFIEYAVKEEKENVQRTFFFDKIFDEMFKYI